MTEAGGFFSDAKRVKSRWMTYAGAQIARTAIARAMYRLKPFPPRQEFSAAIDLLRRDGVLVWPDFLPPQAFSDLRQEFEDFLERHPEKFESSPSAPWSRQARVTSPVVSRLVPRALQLLGDRRLRGVLEGAERRPWREVFRYCTWECVIQRADHHEDPQTTLHADTFFHTHKAWLYLTEVGRDDGCFSIVKGSHKLSLRALVDCYVHSVRADGDPSRRVRGQPDRLGLQETPIICRSNTLVVANTSALHRRMPGAPGRRRCAVHLCARANPFTILRHVAPPRQ
jgi:hypothetical protein